MAFKIHWKMCATTIDGNYVLNDATKWTSFTCFTNFCFLEDGSTLVMAFEKIHTHIFRSHYKCKRYFIAQKQQQPKIAPLPFSWQLLKNSLLSEGKMVYPFRFQWMIKRCTSFSQPKIQFGMYGVRLEAFDCLNYVDIRTITHIHQYTRIEKIDCVLLTVWFHLDTLVRRSWTIIDKRIRAFHRLYFLRNVFSQ